MARELLTDTFLNLRDRFRTRARRIPGNSEDADDALQDRREQRKYASISTAASRTGIVLNL